MATSIKRKPIKTFSIKTGGDNLVAIGNFIQIVDDDTGEEIFPMSSAKINIDKGEVVTITLDLPVSKIDLKGILPDFLPWLKHAIDRYERFNEKRTDGMIYHTDCLDDFIGFLGGTG